MQPDHLIASLYFLKEVRQVGEKRLLRKKTSEFSGSLEKIHPLCGWQTFFQSLRIAIGKSGKVLSPQTPVVEE